MTLDKIVETTKKVLKHDPFHLEVELKNSFIFCASMIMQLLFQVKISQGGWVGWTTIITA